MNKALLALILVLPGCEVFFPSGVIDPSGYLIGAPVGVTTAAHPAIAVKVPGFDAPGGLPPFDRLPSQILPSGFTVTTSPIAAMSMGLEVLWIIPTTLPTGAVLDKAGLPGPLNVAILQLGGHGWTAIGFRVDATTALASGDPLDGDVALTSETELNRTIFNYFLPGSEIESVPMESSPRVAMRPEDLGLAEETEAIHGLDMHMALHHTDLKQFAHIFTERPVTDNPWVYFTLRREFVTTADTSSLSGFWNGLTIDPATIYMSRWNGATWDKPLVYRSRAQLGLTSGLDLAIDALSIDAPQPGTSSNLDTILFSLAGSTPIAMGPESQVLFATPAATETPPRPVVVRQGTEYGSLGKQLGAGVGLGDICVADPWRVQHDVPKPFLDEFFVARRMPPLPPFPVVGGFLAPRHPTPALSIAAYRRLYTHDTGERVPRITTCMSLPRHAENATGMAWVAWGHMPDCESPQNSLLPLGTHNIPYTGGPLTFEIVLPEDGLLRPVGAQPAAANEKKRAYYVQWFLDIDGDRLHSPVAVLRY